MNKKYRLICKILFISLILILLLDCLDIPNIICEFLNINIPFWSSLLINTIPILISGLILYYVTFSQLKQQIINNDRNNEERLRNENLPLILCNFIIEYDYDESFDYVISEHDNGDFVCISIEVKNEGLGAVKDAFISFNNREIELDYSNKITTKGMIPKNNKLKVKYGFNSEKKMVRIDFYIYYVDIFDNCYLQSYELDLFNLRFKDKYGNPIFSINPYVKETKIIDKIPEEIINNSKNRQ